MRHLLFTAFAATAIASPTTERRTAFVDQELGVDLYVHAQPTTPYTTVHSGRVAVLVSTGELVNRAVRQATAHQADGVILDVRTGRFEAITYTSAKQ